MKMKAFIRTAAAAAAAASLLFSAGCGSAAASKSGTAYVESVATLSGKGLVGEVNKFAGVIESPESWSCSLRDGAKVAQVFVQVGDEVKAGDVLFAYDTSNDAALIEEADIEVQRLQASVAKLQKSVESLTAAANAASAENKEAALIDLENEQLSLKKENVELANKTKELESLKANSQDPNVKSEIDGVVTAINDASSTDNMDYGYYDDTEQSASGAYITIKKVGDFQIKGEVSELNISDLYVGAPVVVTSRTDSSKRWTGKVSKLQTGEPDSSGASTVDYSSKYPFYVTLDSDEGLMLGQHVYIEVDKGQYNDDREGIWIPTAYLITEASGGSFVLVDEGGVLKKRAVTLGSRDAELSQVQITSGLSLSDKIAVPGNGVSEGMKATSNAAEAAVDPDADGAEEDNAAAEGEA